MMRQKLYILIALLSATVMSAWSQKTYVLAIGINDYAYVPDLRCCENDVKSFVEVMQRHTNEVYTLKGRQATRANILAKMREVFGKAGKDDTVMLFFSGHGYEGGFCAYDTSSRKASKTGVSYREMQNILGKSKAKNKMVFADACYSGGMRVKKKDGIANVSKGSSVMYFLSSRTNETSQEVAGGSNGQFTRFLVRGLTGGSDVDTNKVVTAKELYDFVHEGVTVATAKRQHPVMWGKFDNNMTVVDWNKKK